jgi:hypothetical protein
MPRMRRPHAVINAQMCGGSRTDEYCLAINTSAAAFEENKGVRTQYIVFLGDRELESSSPGPERLRFRRTRSRLRKGSRDRDFVGLQKALRPFEVN